MDRYRTLFVIQDVILFSPELSSAKLALIAREVFFSRLYIYTEQETIHDKIKFLIDFHFDHLPKQSVEL